MGGLSSHGISKSLLLSNYVGLKFSWPSNVEAREVALMDYLDVSNEQTVVFMLILKTNC